VQARTGSYLLAFGGSPLALLAALMLLSGCGGGGGGSGGGSASRTSALRIANAQVDEGDAGQSAVVFSVTLDPAASVEVSIRYATSGGSAAFPDDFAAASGTLTFAAGATSQQISIAVRGDSLDEADETFRVTLSGPTGGASVADGTADGTILDDDPLPQLAIANASAAEGDAGTTALALGVTLAPASGRTVTVGYATSAGSARSGTDYTSATGSATFAPGQTSASIVLSVRGDTTAESDETFFVTLSNPGNATLLAAQGVATISNDDSGTPPVIGLDARPSNTTCLAPARPTAGASITTQNPFPNTPAFASPTKLLQPPGDPSRWLVLEKGGFVRTFTTANPAAVTTWLDFSGVVNSSGEGGLLGLAFHPNYPATPEVFVSYTTGSPMVSRISRIILDSTSAPVNTTEQILLTVSQPFDNHNGGEIAFGPEDSLYFGLGDGGGANDQDNYAQNTTRLLGSILRIDVVDVAYPSPGYQIPADNPFALNPKCGPDSNAAPCPEIYAWGMRNPWRFSFDPPTGALWAGDVGENTWEEVDLIERGGNYGWRCREGAHDFNTSGCPSGGFVEPVSEYSRSDGNSVTGGFVYRGTALPALVGRYVFADFGSGRIWALRDDGQGGYTNELLVGTSYNISSFGSALDGELYFADYSGGQLYRLVAAGAPTPDTIPASLEATGCVAPGDPTQPAAGLVPYGVNAPFWSDGAEKSRFLALPDGATIDVTASGDWALPAGSVVVKHFRIGAELVETRLLMRHPDGVWAGYTYEWNAAQTAATRVVGGKTRAVAGQSWIYPSEGDCMRCHTATAGFSLGLETAQLNSELLYPSTGRTANQLTTLEEIGFLSTALPDVPANLPTIVDPADASQSLDSRARAYLDTNCAQCHRPGGPTPSSMDLRYTIALSATSACNATPQAGDLGLANARLIAPGDASRSVLIARVSRRDAHGMPPLGSNQVDTAGVSLLTSWVNSLAGCN
jgi:uncharacterized repeat protein (TIGR03806 family)